MVIYETIKDNVISGDRIKDGDYKIEYKKSKHQASLKQYWAMLAFALKNFPEWVEIRDKEVLDDVLKLKCGLVNVSKFHSEIIQTPGSVKLDKLDAVELQKYKNDALDEIFKMFGLGMTDFVASILMKFVHTKGVSNVH